MAIRIAFDLDGVLADMDGALARHAVALFGDAVAHRTPESAPPRPTHDAAAHAAVHDAEHEADAGEPPLAKPRLTSREQRQLWRHVATLENFWGTLEELEPGVIARLAQTAAAQRWEVIFLTKRPASAGETAQVQTQRWLESHGFPLPSVFVVQGSRGKIAAALDLDVVIDDRPDNCLDVTVESKARAILICRDAQSVPPAAERLGITVARSVAECLDLLDPPAAVTNRQPRPVDRLKRLLGFKEPAAV